MKFVLPLACILSISLFAQKKKDLPPGFVWVKEKGLLVSQTEITVNEWAEFMRNFNSQASLAPVSNPINDKCVCLRDGDQVTVFSGDGIVYRDTTFIPVGSKKGKKVHFQEWCPRLPITGITIEQAQDFAKWLTEKYLNDSDAGFTNLGLEFRLPTPEEMNGLLGDTFKQSKPGQDVYEGYKNGINSHGCAVYNHAHNSWCDNNKNMKLYYGYKVPMETLYFFPDVNGLYDLMGNVAEMTSEPGVSMGGSCIHSASECQPNAKITYDGPQPWLGFRLVAEFKGTN